MDFPQRPFYFVRHGQTEWNLIDRVQGQTDIPLNQTGIQQAAIAAEKAKLLPLTQIITSPLLRTLKTAAIISEAKHLPMLLDRQLIERSYGSYEGQYLDDIQRQHGLSDDGSIDRVLPSDAETWAQLVARSHAAVEKWLTACPNDVLLFVGHAAFFRALYESLGGPSTGAENGKIYHFIPHAHGWQVEEL